MAQVPYCVSWESVHYSGCHLEGQTERISNYGKCYFWSQCPTDSSSVTAESGSECLCTCQV